MGIDLNEVQRSWDRALKLPPDSKNEIECLKLFESGWKQDGFEHVDDSQDIITHWKKDRMDRKSIRLTFAQQKRWMLVLEKQKKEKNMNQKNKVSQPILNKGGVFGVGATSTKAASVSSNSTITTGTIGNKTTINPGTITYTGTTLVPQSTTIPYYGYNTITTPQVKQKYSIFKLPMDNIIPNKVYVMGKLVTVGILGTNVQAAFAGGDKLIFSPGEIIGEYGKDNITVSLDYGDWLYHYNVSGGVCAPDYISEDSNILKAKLVSKVAQR